MSEHASLFLDGFREPFPDLCWRLLGDSQRVCILSRGHDGGIHEGDLSERDAFLVAVAGKTCVYLEGGQPPACVDEWPSNPQQWCGACLAKHALNLGGQT